MKKKLRIGVLSDIHVTDDASTMILRRAFDLFRAQKVDGVLIAGDLAERGRVDELVRVGRVWREVFAGTDVEKLFVYGNHDIEGWTYQYLKAEIKAHPELYADRNLISKNPAAAWKTAFGEDYPGDIYLKRVKGYAFVGVQFKNGKDAPDLAQFLSAHAAELKGSEPFFYCQHVHPAGTCSAPWTCCQDDGASTRALSRFPNAVALSGHSHKPLTNELNVWQGSFTSIGTASLFSLGHPVGRENGMMADLNARQVMGNDAGRKKNQPVAIHGQFVRVYEDFIEIERIEFVTGKSLGPNLVIPLPAAKEKPFLFATQARKATAPASFPEGAEVAVAREEKPLRGTTVPVPVVAATFPQTRFAAGVSRTADYEIAVEATEVDVTQIVLTRYLAAPSDLFPVSAAAKRRKLTCRLAASLLPKGVTIAAGAVLDQYGSYDHPYNIIELDGGTFANTTGTLTNAKHQFARFRLTRDASTEPEG